MSHYKPYPAYKPSGVEWIGKLPEHWEVKRLEYVTSTHRENVTSQALASSEVMHYSIPVVQETGRGAIEDGSTIDSNKLVVREPQVLISKLNPRKSTVVIADADQNRLTVASTEFVPLLPQAGKSTLEFITLLVGSANFRQLLESKVESVTKSHQRVLPEDITKAVLAIPPVAEQAKIAVILDRETTRIDALITKKTRFIELLKEKRQALITHAVTKGLDPNVKMRDSGVEWIGEVPEHWVIRSIKGIVSTPITDGPHETPAFYDHGIPFVSAEAISGGYINFRKLRGYISKDDHEAYSRKCKPQKDDIFMIKSGATTGVTAIVDTDIEFNIWSPLAVVRCNDSMVPFFVLNYMRSHSFLEGVSQNWSFGTQQNIGMGVIGDLPTPVPPLHEQKVIASYLKSGLERLNSLTQKTQRSIDLLKERRSAFITAAVTGQIDLRESV